VGAAQGAGAGAGDGLELLEVQAATRFALDAAGRILHEQAPDLGPAPRLWFAGSAEGNALRLRADVPDGVARAAMRLVADEPPHAGRDRVPACLDALAGLLGGEPAAGLTYVFREAPPQRSQDELVSSGTPNGERLLRQGLPPAFAGLGFREEDELWPPWCVALDGDSPVAIAFSARLSPLGAEAGVFTVPGARGRGFAVAATEGWAGSPALRGRARFYSTSADNLASQRVAERLGLALVGPSFEIR
jgi:hypothetical protein